MSMWATFCQRGSLISTNLIFINMKHKNILPIAVAFMGMFNIVASGQIVADHTVVDQYDDIPQQYMDAVKTMLVSLPGESHATTFRIGPNLLEQMNSAYQVETYAYSTPPAETNQYLRIGGHRMAGEDFFFSQSRITEMKGEITDQYNSGNPFDVMGFGWCYDMTRGDAPGGGEDPDYHVRWAGRSEGSPSGSMRWGLDSDDEVLTGNVVSMDTYLDAVDSYIQFCSDNSYPTKWIFTTGPVDRDDHAGSENGFQREIKHDYIRNYVSQASSRILFDYADILCWNNSGEQNLTDWNDDGTIRSHAHIHPDNMMDYDASWNPVPHDEDGDHIGEVGTVRLAKALWWLLARMAGWEPGTISVEYLDEDNILNSDISLVVGPDHMRVGTSGIFDRGDLSLFDINGRLIETANIEGMQAEINTSSLSAGSYVVMVSKDHRREFRKIVILP